MAFKVVVHHESVDLSPKNSAVHEFFGDNLKPREMGYPFPYRMAEFFGHPVKCPPNLQTDIFMIE